MWRGSKHNIGQTRGPVYKKDKLKSPQARCFSSTFPSLVTREFAMPRERGEMGFVNDTVESIRSMQIRQVLMQIISLGDALCPSLLSC